MKLTRIMALLLAVVLFSAGAAQAQQGVMVPKVSSFDYMVDYSGSMLMKHQGVDQNKMEMTKMILMGLDSKIPALQYSASLHTFAPYSELLPQSPWSPARMDQAVMSISTEPMPFGRMTPMSDGFAAARANYITQLPGRSAVILVSDGEANRGGDPVAAARAMLAANPNVCLHIISMADSPEGQATLNALSQIQSCSVMVYGPELLANDDAMDRFVRAVFYDYQMAATPPPVVIEEAIVLNDIQFAFDSSALDGQAEAILNSAANILRNSNRNVVIAGHTCSIGTEQYNQGLSERRANAVRDYLVRQGIPASRMTTVGYGELRPKYDNGSAEGRRLNRRVELMLQ